MTKTCPDCQDTVLSISQNAGKLACRRCGGWGTIMLGNGDRETCDLCHGTTVDPDQSPAALAATPAVGMIITDTMIEAGARIHNPFAFDIAGTSMPVHRAQSRNEARREVHAILSAALAAAPAVDATQGAFECMGRKQSLPEPGECNWPDCGCDPHAMKVIESLLEQGWTGPGGS